MSGQADNISTRTQIAWPFLWVQCHREHLIAVERGELPWSNVDAWNKQLHRDFERALAESKLPECPDHEAANCFLIKARPENQLA